MSKYSGPPGLERVEAKLPFQDTLEELRGVPGAPVFAIKSPAPFWRRLWFVISFVPRYLISGSVEVP